MSSLQHRFGAHLSIAAGVQRALRAGRSLGCQVVQLFVKNQRQWHARPLEPADVQQWQKLQATCGLDPPVAQAGYLINLASPDPKLHARSFQALVDELERCDLLDIPYLVIHPGSATDGSRARGIARVAATLNRVFEQHPRLRTMPLLETTAGQGNALGRSFEELGEIIRSVQEPRRIGVCIDTCHVFAAGYDIRRPEGYRAMVQTAVRQVGLDRIRCWHLNDSRAPCGSHLDRHEHIGRGWLGKTAFINLLADTRFVGLPMIIETPKGTDGLGRNWDRLNLRRLRAIAADAGSAAAPAEKPRGHLPPRPADIGSPASTRSV